ncbi:MAG TPA: hypothetical protein VHX62_05930 [Solirubrobacteraceae bacterium]|jgi:hypothetical protein|nr:hypothetical protein [Solirubrobacteraceae bacterium]
MTTNDIVTSIDQRLTAVKAEIVQLEGARQALINGAAPSAKPTPRRTPRKTARKTAPAEATAPTAEAAAPKTAPAEAAAPKTAPPETVAPKPAPRKTAPRKTARRGYEVVPAGKLTTLLEGSAGMSTPDLAKATNGKPDQILALLRELEKADQIRRSGERRGTRWHLITDEDRIAARAAEIAAQSKRRRRTAA